MQFDTATPTNSRRPPAARHPMQEDAAQWKLNALAALIEVTSAVDEAHDVAAGASQAADLLARFLGCERVVIALGQGRHLTVRAISGMRLPEISSPWRGALRAALLECQQQNGMLTWPAAPDGLRIRSHQVVAGLLGAHTVISFPLVTAAGQAVGSILLAGEDVGGARTEKFVYAIGPRLAATFSLLEFAHRTSLRRAWEACRAPQTWRRSLPLAVMVLVFAGLLVKVPYRVRCGCVVEPMHRHLAVAPFEGLVEATHVEAGDVVEPGTLLATMQGHELRLQLGSLQAEHAQVQKRREVKLRAGDVPGVLTAQLEADRLRAQLELAQHRLQQLALTAPRAGVVLTSALARGQGGPVRRGDVLFEVSSLAELRVEVEIPAEDVAHIAVGQEVTLRLDGQEDQPCRVAIESIRPRSQLRGDRNVFVATAQVRNPDARLQVGMRGTARIHGAPQTLAWILFHKPMQYLRARWLA